MAGFIIFILFLLVIHVTGLIVVAYRSGLHALTRQHTIGTLSTLYLDLYNGTPTITFSPESRATVVSARGAGLARGSHRLCEPAHLRLDSVSEHASDVVPPRVSVDRASGFIVAVLLGPGVEEVADLPRRVAGAATVHFEDERQEARPGRGADRGRGRHMAVEAVAFAAGHRVSGGHAHAAVEVARGGADARARVGRAVYDGDVDDGGLVRRRVRFGLEVGAQDAEVGVAPVQVQFIRIVVHQ